MGQRGKHSSGSVCVPQEFRFKTGEDEGEQVTNGRIKFDNAVLIIFEACIPALVIQKGEKGGKVISGFKLQALFEDGSFSSLKNSDSLGKEKVI